MGKSLIILLLLVSIVTVSCKKNTVTEPEPAAEEPDSTVVYMVAIVVYPSGQFPRAWMGYYERTGDYYIESIDGYTTKTYYISVVLPYETLHASVRLLQQGELELSFIDSYADTLLRKTKAKNGNWAKLDFP